MTYFFQLEIDVGENTVCRADVEFDVCEALDDRFAESENVEAWEVH